MNVGVSARRVEGPAQVTERKGSRFSAILDFHIYFFYLLIYLFARPLDGHAVLGVGDGDEE